MTTKHTLTNQKIIASTIALAELDRADDKGKPLFKFPGSVRLKLAKRLRQLNAITEDIEKVKRQLAAEHGITGDVDANKVPLDPRDARIAFNGEMNELMEETVEIECGKIPLADLRIDDNAIPLTSLVILDWLIEQDAEA